MSIMSTWLDTHCNIVFLDRTRGRMSRVTGLGHGCGRVLLVASAASTENAWNKGLIEIMRRK